MTSVPSVDDRTVAVRSVAVRSVSRTAAPAAPADGAGTRTAVTRDASAGPPPPRLMLLDGLRFLAAAAVVAYHLAGRQTSAWGPDQVERLGDVPRWTSYGSLGPELFFVISGFVVLLTAWGRPTVRLVASRLARLYPAYWAGVLLTGGLLLVLWPDGKDVTPAQVLVNLTMVQSALGVPHVDGVYWTLWAELRFYLLVGLLSLVGLTRRRVLAVALVWPWLAQLALHHGLTGLATALVADYASLFAAGMALYVLHRDGHRLDAWLVVATNTVLAVLLVVPSRAAVLARTTGYEPSELLLGVGVVVCVALVACAVLTPLARARATWCVTLGALTYPVYLVHDYWGLYVVHLTAPYVPTAVALALAVGAALALAWLVHRCVELPCGPRVRRWSEQALVRVRGVVLDRVNRGPRLVRGLDEVRVPG
ncbi:acyltransferase [Cellulomonas sp. H30R-01]|uniref:acyltransferase family protein n=1 Tax=Cellulomonas sp. H30R-01 TaxID=2704467 RepID=UPI00138BD7AB|nr:acyltransferase [Cellulomonas sp. H30R-01]QHT56341.1 acyltransferase [Cellulomonas sp. H30R-01]